MLFRSTYYIKTFPPPTLCVVGNPTQAGGYAVRMENTIPLVTQAPPIQPLQMRPGVIAQVRCLLELAGWWNFKMPDLVSADKLLLYVIGEAGQALETDLICLRQP